MNDEYIQDIVYAPLAAAADKLYARYLKDLAVELTINQLNEIDNLVKDNGTTEANIMLDEIFKHTS